MPNTTNRVKLPYILQSQSQKEVTHNASLDLIDALLQAAMVSVGVNTPPGSPVAGDSYIVGSAPTGAWAGQAKALAFYTTAWNFIAPWEGLTVWANDVNTLYTYDGAAWVLTVNPTSFQNLTMLGVNTSADSTNKFAVASAAILFNHIGTDMQVKINKNAAGNKASFLFQTGFSGRAEFGLLGDDNFTLKVSADGSTFFDALKMLAANGRVALKSNAAGLSGAGTTQGTATAITKQTNEFTTVAAGTGGILPSPEQGEFICVANAGANALAVYPASGHSINALSEITQKAKAWGLRTKKGYALNKATIYRLMMRQFYYGEMEIKGVLYPHCYPPIISRELFKACEDVRLGYNKKPFRYRGKDFIFRGLLTCGTTGKMVTADTKKRIYKNGESAEWTYLRCWKPDDAEKIMWVREDSVLEQVADIFNHLGIKNPEMLQNVVDYIKETNRAKKAFHNQEVGQLKKQHTEIQDKLDRLVDLRLEGEITKEEFETKKNRLKDRQYELDQLILTYDKADDQFTKTLCALLTIASDSDKIWLGSTISEKRELLNFVFANLQLKGATLCYELRKPFDKMLNQADCIKWRKG